MLQLDSNNMAAAGTSVIEKGRIEDSVEKLVGPVNLQTSEDSGLQQKSENEAENNVEKSNCNESIWHNKRNKRGFIIAIVVIGIIAISVATSTKHAIVNTTANARRRSVDETVIIGSGSSDDF